MIFRHVGSITPYSSGCALVKSDWWLQFVTPTPGLQAYREESLFCTTLFLTLEGRMIQVDNWRSRWKRPNLVHALKPKYIEKDFNIQSTPLRNRLIWSCDQDVNLVTVFQKIAWVRKRMWCSGKLENQLPSHKSIRKIDGNRCVTTQIHIVYFNSRTRLCTNWKLWNNWQRTTSRPPVLLLSSVPLLFDRLSLFSGRKKKARTFPLFSKTLFYSKLGCQMCQISKLIGINELQVYLAGYVFNLLFLFFFYV